MSNTDTTPLIMPDGTPFEFWDDATRYTRTYHVACEQPGASDVNPGTAGRPFATIGRAAAVLQPGEKVIVHRGAYRECVRPARGGTAADAMIAYEAAPGETVRIAGSMLWKPPARPSEGWRIGPTEASAPEESARVLMADLPPEWFAGYNPFIANNMSAEFTTFTSDWSNDEKQRMQLSRGMIFCNGKPLRQVFRITELAKQDGAFWVEDPGLRIHFRLPGDAAPDSAELEATAHEQCFAPAERGLGWIRVSGFIVEHAADGVPVPQRAMLSTYRGHHWIIEDCTVRHANSTGIDAGNESWHAGKPEGRPVGHHIIRRNHVSDCGVCGIAGVGSVDATLVEDNIVERIGEKNIERIWETGGLKFHVCKTVLIRRNVFRHVRHAPGVWLDYLNENCRITGNVFADIECLNGGVYLEVSHAPNLIDHNIFWDIRAAGADPLHPWGGAGVNVDTGEKAIVVHNLFGGIRGNYAVLCHLGQAARVVGGRTGLCRTQKVLNNVFIDCPKRILFSRRENNISDGNLFDARNDGTSFCVEFPAPQVLQNLAGWQEHFGLDLGSAQAKIEAHFDPETCELTLDVEGEVTKPVGSGLPEGVIPKERTTPGPFELKQGKQVVKVR
ncbi:MAG TPA: right-handed parallel beta-helix repeat-containing protein [Planctomycetota bacterium]|nr:right-handed parallel beta-helix repeat-containing protein [Planctomycetota bacterium]